MENIMTREEVYKLIDSERIYQKNLACERNWTEDERNPAKSVGDFITLLDVYVQKAQVAYADKAGNTSAMEKHGAPEREHTCKNV